MALESSIELPFVTHHILKDEGKRGFGVDDVVQRDNVGVLQLLEERCLSNGREGSALLLLQADLLQGDHLVRQAERGSIGNDESYCIEQFMGKRVQVSAKLRFQGCVNSPLRPGGRITQPSFSTAKGHGKES